MQRKTREPAPLPSSSRRLAFTLDVLTDGSERTGPGIFLTVRRGPAIQNCDSSLSSGSAVVDDGDPLHTILARYALCGLPTLTARLCADQRLKLAPIRATFIPHLGAEVTTGIPSLLLALNNAGAGKLLVAGPTGIDALVETMVDIVLGRRFACPSVTTCELPATAPAGGDEKNCKEKEDSQRNDGSTVGVVDENCCWWKVYEDEFLLVHGRYITTDLVAGERKGGVRQLDSKKQRHQLLVAYTYTIRCGKHSSFAVLPPGIDATSPLLPKALLPLPAECCVARHPHQGKYTPYPLAFLLFLDPSSPSNSRDNLVVINEDDKITVLAKNFLGTFPDRKDDDEQQPEGWDEGILIHASRQIRNLNNHLPFAFPIQQNINKKANNDPPPATSGSLNAGTTVTVSRQHKPIFRLHSCTSVVLSGFREGASNIECFELSSKQSMRFIDRRHSIWNRIEKKKMNNTTEGVATLGELREEVSEADIAKLEALYTCKNGDYSNNNVTIDENEISIEEEENDSDMERNTSNNERHSLTDLKQPQLIVLGSGCASPSPQRGSSGYALLLPTNGSDGETPQLEFTTLIECGEGSLTALERHLRTISCSSQVVDLDTWLRKLRFVWISHAHLDHYGELPLFIQAIAEAGGRTNSCVCGVCGGPGRKPGCTCMLPPVVIAPPKVLRFLEASLQCNNVARQKMTPRKRSLSRQCNNDDNSLPRLYFGISNRDFECSPFASPIREMIFNLELTIRAQEQGASRNDSPRVYRPFLSIQNVPVDHCPQAHALLMDLHVCTEAFTLCYSGDTRPSHELVLQCKESLRKMDSFYSRKRGKSLLIHECTFDDDKTGKEQAVRKRHSTVQEALTVARDMQVDCCLLTHFSQRYPLLPPGAESKRKANNGFLSVCSALDGMTIPLLEASAVLPLLNSCAKHILRAEAHSLANKNSIP